MSIASQEDAMSSSSPDPSSPEPPDDLIDSSCSSYSKCISSQAAYDNEFIMDDYQSDSSISSSDSEDSMDSDMESGSFTDVTPLHSISNSPLPTQQKLRDSIGGTDEEITEESDSDDCSREDGGVCFGKTTRRATVKRAPGTRSVPITGLPTPQNETHVGNISEAIQKLDISQRSRRMRDQDRRIEQENEHLLKRILAQKSRIKSDIKPPAITNHVPSSAINRRRQQNIIHAQNLALHKRIETARNGSPGGAVASSSCSPVRRTPLRKHLSGQQAQTNTVGPISRQRHDTR